MEKSIHRNKGEYNEYSSKERRGMMKAILMNPFHDKNWSLQLLNQGQT